MHMKRHGVLTPHHDPHCTDGKAEAQGSEATLYPHKGKTDAPNQHATYVQRTIWALRI